MKITGKMDRLAAFWNWLPAFRAVAETEHLPSAAKRMGVTAPALSRSIRLLEDQVGAALFTRAGRSLQLTENGRVFLHSIREGMRRIDDGLERISHAPPRGPLWISARSALAQVFVIPAMERLRATYPEVVPDVDSIDSQKSVDRLQNGTLDMVVTESPTSADNLQVVRLMNTRYSVWCGRSHALYERDSVSPEELADHSFVAPPAGYDDGWPPEVPRHVVLRVWAVHLGVACCAQGKYLAFLMDEAVRCSAFASQMRSVPVNVSKDVGIYALLRKPTDFRGLPQLALESLQEQVKSM